MGWDWSDGQLEDLDRSAREIGFTNIRVNLDSLIEKLLQPVLRDVNRYVKPLRTVVDIVTAPIPVIRQLWELTHLPGAPPSMLTLIEEHLDDVRLIRRVAMLLDFIDAVSRPGAQPGDVPIGSFHIDPDLARGDPLPPGDRDQLIVDPQFPQDEEGNPDSVRGEREERERRWFINRQELIRRIASSDTDQVE